MSYAAKFADTLLDYGKARRQWRICYCDFHFEEQAKLGRKLRRLMPEWQPTQSDDGKSPLYRALTQTTKD
jgi:hypothetical protein